MIRTYEKMTEESKAEEESKKKKEIEDQQDQSSEQAAPSDETSPARVSATEKLFSPEVVQRINAIRIDLTVNPNAFLHSPCDVDEKTVEADEHVAKDLASFLWDCVLPNITELVRLGEEAPYDGKSLTQFLHSRGVNMRYLGELSRRARAEEEIDRKTQLENQKRKNPMPVFWQDLLEVEIIARCMKHLINSFIAGASSKMPSSSIISHLFNLLMGNGEITPEVDLNELVSEIKSTGDKKKKGGKKGSKGQSKQTVARVSATIPAPESFNLSKEDFWKQYLQLAKSKFLHSDSLLFVANPSSPHNGNPFLFSKRLSKLSILRRICQICGIRIQCKDYDWNVPSPFAEADIQDIVPLVKSCEPDTPLPAAKYLLDEAKLLLQQGNIISAYERSQDASKYLSQVVGPVHPEMSRALSYLYVVLLRIGDMKSALSTLAKKLTVDVQLHGLDSAETLQNHLNMSLGYQEVGNYLAAAAHIRSAVYILRLLCGDQHPEISSIYLRLSGIYNEVGNTELAFKCLKIAKELVYLNGDQGTHALICQNMAGLHAQFDQFKEAIALQKECYIILRQLFGEQDSKTADAKVRFETLIRKSAERNEHKSEREKKDKEGAAADSSLWLDDNFGAKNSKKGSNKSKKGKKK
jgi:protein TIF31